MTAAVFLDVGGVLVMPGHDLVGAVADDHGGRPTPPALFRGHYEGIAAGERTGGFDWTAYRSELLGAAGVPVPRRAAASGALAAAMAGPAAQVWDEVLPGAVEGLGVLGATGAPLAVVSNSDGTVAALLRRLELCQVGPGPGVAVAAVVDSGAVGLEKPDPAIFRDALAAVATAPVRCAHVGDTVYADVDGAHAAGIRAVHLDPIGWCHATGHDHVRTLAEVAGLLTRAA